MVEVKKESSSLQIPKKTQKKKKRKRKNGVKELQSCDRGSLPSSFLLLVLCSAQ